MMNFNTITPVGTTEPGTATTTERSTATPPPPVGGM